MTGPLLAALLLGACALDSMEPDDGFSDGKADDLGGLKLTIYPRPSTEIWRDGERTWTNGGRGMRPTVQVRDGFIDIETDDLRPVLPLTAGPWRSMLSLSAPADSSGLWTSYAFQIQIPNADATAWEPARALANSDDWFWSGVWIESRSPGKMTISGLAVRAEDAFRVAREELLKFTTIEIPIVELPNQELALRVLVIPIWDFGSWDPDGYSAAVQLSTDLDTTD